MRVITYNIRDNAVSRENLILEVLQAAEPDVVVLQEVGRSETAAQWAKALGLEFCFAAGNSKRHLALLSRLPIRYQNSYHPLPLSTTLLEATLQVTSGQQLHVCGVHLAAQPFVLFEMWRWWEIAIILRRIKARLSQPCLLAGDFNAIAPDDSVNVNAWPRRLKRMLDLQGGRVLRRVISEVRMAGFVDCFRSLHPQEDGYTLPTPTPNSRLDYIFVNEMLNGQLAECRVMRDPSAVEQASDHYPLLAEFS